MFGRDGKVRGGVGRGGGKDGGGNDGPVPGAHDEEFDGLVLDESFIKAATVKEESARTRQLREQWKKEPPEAQRWRSWEGGALQHKMSGPGPQTDAQWDQSGRSGSSRGFGYAVRRSIVPVVVLGLIGGGYLFSSHRHIQPLANVPVISSNLTAMPAAGARGAAVDAQVSVAPTASCFAGAAGCGSPDRPYADSPALAWADAAAGITLPAPARTGAFSASQVAADLAPAKQFVVDQALVPNVLVGGAPPAALIGLIAPESSFAGLIGLWTARPTAADDPTGLFVRFDPKTSTLLTTPKVAGTLTYSQPTAGTLQVETSVKVVYALQKPDRSAWTRTIATVTDKLDFFDGSAGVAATTGKVLPNQLWISGYADARCTPEDGFEEPSYLTDGGPGSGPLSSGPAEDPYATTAVTAPPTPVGTATAGAYTCDSISRD